MTQSDVIISPVDQMLNVDVIISSPSASALASLQELTTLVLSAVEQAKASAELARKAADEAQDTATTIQQQAEAVQQAHSTIIEINASITAAAKTIAEQAEAVAKAEAAVKEQAELVTQTGANVQQQADAVAAAERLIKQCTEYVKDRAADIVIAQQQINDVYNQVAQAEIDSAQSAKTSCDCADRSEQAAHQSATSAYAAQLAEQNSQSHQNSAENSEVLAKRSADYAQQAEQAIRLLIADVDDKILLALDSAKKAEQWAENPIDMPVEPGRYSAKHWARKAEQFTGSMTNALIFRGPWDASTGTAPPLLTPKTPDFYKITQAGIIGSVSYNVGDSIVLDVNNESWFKLDGTDHPITSDLDVDSELIVASARAAMLLNQNKLERTETAVAADKLAKPFTLQLSGDSTGQVSLDGSQSAELAVTVVNDSHAHSTATVTGLDEALANKLDKTETAIAADKLAKPFTLQLTGDSTGQVSLDGAQTAQLPVTVLDDSHVHTQATITGLEDALAAKLDRTGNAVTASRWQTERTISLSGDASGAVAIDGQSDVTLPVTVLDDSHVHTQATITGLSDRFEHLETQISQVSNPNLIINGLLSQPVNQRNSGGNWGAISVGDYGYDRWKKHANGIEQIIEGTGLIAGTICLHWQGGGTGYINNVAVSSGDTATIPAATNVSIVVPTNADQVKAEYGNKPTPFIPDDPSTALLRCQRYYCQAMNVGVIAIVVQFALTISHGGYPAYVHYYPTTMRTSPTVTIYAWNSNNTLGSTGKLYKIFGNDPTGESVIQVISRPYAFNLQPYEKSLSNGLYWGYFTADAEL